MSDPSPKDPTGPHVNARSLAWRTLVFSILWWVLAEGRADLPGVALLAIAAAVACSFKLFPTTAQRVSPAGLLSFAGFFLVESVRAGVQVAWMALRPRTGLDPALLRVPLTLPPGLPTVLLLNTLTLLPGTLSVRIEGAELTLHVLDRRRPIEAAVRAAEARIARMLEIAP